MQASDMQVIKDIPGYKVILKAVLKSQIQQLVEQLADNTGEESVILTASVSDGSLSHLGSESGKVFLEDHDDIKSQFLGFCLKRHHRQKQIEKEKQQQPLPEPGGRILMAPNTPRFGPGPKPRFAPRAQPSPRHISPQQSPRGVHPVSLTRASPQGRGASNVRHEPYSAKRPRKSSTNFDPSSHTRLPTKSPMKLPIEAGNPNQVIKIEAVEDDGSQGDQTSAAGQSDMENGAPGSSQFQSSSASSSPSHTALPPTPTSQSVQSPLVKDDGSESSSSTIVNEPTEVKYSDTIPAGGLSLDSDLSNLTGIQGESAKMDTAESNSGAEQEMDPNVNIKVEAVTESELDDLEITGVEPGQMPQSDNWMPDMDYGPSTSGAQGDMSGAQGGAGYMCGCSQNLRESFLHDCTDILPPELLKGLTASDADTLVAAVLSASCWSNLDTEMTEVFYVMHIPLSGTAVEDPVIIHEYVHTSSFEMQALARILGLSMTKPIRNTRPCFHLSLPRQREVLSHTEFINVHILHALSLPDHSLRVTEKATYGKLVGPTLSTPRGDKYYNQYRPLCPRDDDKVVGTLQGTIVCQAHIFTENRNTFDDILDNI